MRKIQITVLLFLVFAISIPGQEAWKAQNSRTTANLVDVTYGNDQFVAVGAGGVIVTSPDGIMWKTQSSGTTKSLRKILWADSLFVAGGESGALFTSLDGSTWADHSLGTGQYVSDIAWGADKFVLFTGNELVDNVSGGSRTTFCSNVYTSTDGLAWIKQVSKTGRGYRNLAWGNNVFVAFSEFNLHSNYYYNKTSRQYISLDGINWSFQSEQAYVSTLFYANMSFLAYGLTPERFASYGSQIISTDGISWTTHEVFPDVSSRTSEGVNDICWGAGRFIILSYNGLVPQTNFHYCSSDDFVWQQKSMPMWTVPRLNGISYGDSMFAAVGDSGSIYTSIPGVGPINVPTARNSIERQNVEIVGNSIRYSLHEIGPVSLNLFSLNGQLIISLYDGLRGPGMYRQTISSEIAQGMYIVSLKAGETSVSHKFILGGTHE